MSGDAELDRRRRQAEASPVDGASIPRRATGRLRVELRPGDLSREGADVLVNAANDELAMGGGVAGALLGVAGVEVQREASRQAPAALGRVVRTGAGRANARWIYHAVVIRHSLRAGTSAADVRVVTRRVVAMAAEDGARSVALPLFGAGVGGLSVARSLEAILEGLEDAGDLPPTPLTVRIVVLDEGDHRDAVAAWEAFPDRATRQAQVDEAAEDYLRVLERRLADGEGSERG